MSNITGSIRLWITASTLLGANMLLHSVGHGERIVPHRPLAALPYTIGAWTGEELPIQQRIVQAVGVSDYTNRVYAKEADASIQLYVGYYASQETGDTIHSPKNCLPGAGWEPIQIRYATVPLGGERQILVNESVIQKDLIKQMVFYWYQGRGRVIASEYSAKFWMVADAISRNRTDGALVRVVTPIDRTETDARARLVSFTQLLFPQLDVILPN